MSPIEKAEAALNRRIERLQENLRAADSEATQQFLVQSLVVSLGLGEALTDYVKAIGAYAQARHGELKQTHDSLKAEHAGLLASGQEMLERLKTTPTDRAIRKEIEVAQNKMTAIQKTLKRGANALQRELAPSLAMIDELAATLRRLTEADQIDALKRATKLAIGHAHTLYRAQPNLPAKDIVDAEAWEKSAGAEIEEASDFHAAYARAAYQALLAIDVMTMAVSPDPPASAEAATARANAAVAARIKAITTRLASDAPDKP